MTLMLSFGSGPGLILAQTKPQKKAQPPVADPDEDDFPPREKPKKGEPPKITPAPAPARVESDEPESAKKPAAPSAPKDAGAKLAEDDAGDWLIIAAIVAAPVLIGLVIFILTRLYPGLGFRSILWKLRGTRRYGAHAKERRQATGIRMSSQIDEYHLVRIIHSGQNSLVWEVFDEIGNQHLAMKILMHPKAQDATLRTSLRREWEVAQDIDHPNLIHCDQYVEDETSAYLIMDLFISRKLREYVQAKQKSFMARYGRQIVEQIASALVHVHAQGWVHRDIKPANILVNTSGEVRLIDFGLAKRSEVSWWENILPTRRAVQGSMSYMSPEQVRGERTDNRADIYSLGATMYEMYTGRPPLVGHSPSDLLNKHLTQKPLPASRVNPELSDEFSALLQWMLEKRPEHRPPDVRVILQRLQGTPVFKGEGAPCR
jgi:hypothetical protein